MYCSPSCSKDSHLWLGLVAFVIGAVVLLQRFDLVPAETWDYLWPSILVIVGLKLMMIGTCCKNDRTSCSPCEGDACDSGTCDPCGCDPCTGACRTKASPAPAKKVSKAKSKKRK